MRVLINNNLYDIDNGRFVELLNVASSFVPHGIYAVIKDDYCELRCDIYENEFELRREIKKLEKDGFAVKVNR